MLSWRLEQHPSLPSTQDHLIALARSGAPEYLAVLAARQTAGRGQYNRVWQAPEGNLNLSLLLRPGTSAREAPQWSLAIGVAVAQVVGAVLAGGVGAGGATPHPIPPHEGEGEEGRGVRRGLRLKYPNDLILNGAKLGGILIDSEATGSRLDWMVAGIGINVASAPDVPEQATTSLAAHNVAITAERLAQDLLSHIARWRANIDADGFAPVRAAWLGLALDPEGARAALEGRGFCVEAPPRPSALFHAPEERRAEP